MPKPLVSLVLFATIIAGPATAATSAKDLAKAGNPEDRAFLPTTLVDAGTNAWQADGRSALYIESGTGSDWYHVQLLAPCINLPYATIINYITDADDQFDVFSSILVRGQRCWFKSIETTDAPPKDGK